MAEKTISRQKMVTESVFTATFVVKILVKIVTV